MIHRSAFHVLLLQNRHTRPARLGRMAHPTRIAATYSKRIREGILADAQALVRKVLVPVVEHLAGQEGDRISHDASEPPKPGDVGAAVDTIEKELASKWTRERIGKVVTPIAQNLESFQATQLNRVLRPLVSVDVVGAEPWLDSTIATFTRENVALIKSIPTRLFSDLEQVITQGLSDGDRWEDLAGEIEDRFSVSESRAELIARDQAGKFFGDLNRVRQDDLGITEFVWRTMNDNRVREEHADREGETYEWSAPPEGGPGEPVLCRCYAEPVIPSAD